MNNGEMVNQKQIKVGVVGLSEHSAAYTKIINGELQQEGLAKDCIVSHWVHPAGNADVEFSSERLEYYRKTLKASGVEWVKSIKKLTRKVDAVMLLTNDGRPHLDQIQPILKAGLPVYVDKPVAENYSQVSKIFALAEKYNCPIYSSSPLRYGKSISSLSAGEKVGSVLGAETFGPAPIQPAHVDLFWDGIHGIELLFTVMGPGCDSVSRVFTADVDLVTGYWKDGRVGLFRGIRKGKMGFGGRIYGDQSIQNIQKFEGYRPLVEEIVHFFQSGVSPVPVRDTL